VIEIIFNGDVIQSKGKTLADFLVSIEGGSKQFAVAVNERFIARVDYAEVHLKAGDRIELVTPMAGG
jgi:sulfur carrier protein